MRAGAMVVTAVLVGCNSVPGTAICFDESWCDGSKVMICRTVCGTPNDCEREFTETRDCADSTVGPKVCTETTTSNGYDRSDCLDEDPDPCTVEELGRLECSPRGPTLNRWCIDTPDGPFWDTQGYCTDGTLCGDGEFGGIFCYPPGAPSCAVDTPPRCVDADTIEDCHGNSRDGYVLIQRDCPAGCTVDGSDVRCN